MPRNRTLSLTFGWGGQYTNHGLTNPFQVQEGHPLLWEPLFYYSIFADKEIPWLAESGKYNDDYTELTITLREGPEWSDGVPITSADVKYTLDLIATNDKLNYHAQFQEFVNEVTAPDDRTVVIKLKSPNPRFKFEMLSFKFDTGIPIVPKHVFEKVPDILDFPGGNDIVHSGMFNTFQTPQQKIWDVRDDWWGFKIGFQPKPDVQRVTMIPMGDMTIAAQRVVNNECDSCLDLRPSLIRTVVQENPKIITHTGRDEPLGYIDWWPNSLWVNTALEPYSNPDVRWAMNLAIDRDTIDKVVYNGAKITTIFPYPEYPGLRKYLDPVRAKGEQLVRRFDLQESAARMEKAGFTKDAEGFWVKDGQRVNATIHGFESIHADITPVLVEMLRRGGFEAAINFGSDAYNNMAEGKPGLYLFGHGASVLDPYATMELYHSRFAAPIGTATGGNRFSRYSNAEFDAIVDEMRVTAPGDPKLNELFEKAIDIYWTDMIDIPMVQWLHRIPYNQTYWTNWPTQENPYVNGAFWALTFPLIVMGLKAVEQ
ncbi:MAG: ABC transporter substrate-binding protein [Anaerolineae bacterium]|nr:ABC transporter substrate-binding protein [Thermoflexales bacterium]MDW8408537.1 ABC transporter substrate-binding protein [Anaerolineae bacterium]